MAKESAILDDAAAKTVTGRLPSEATAMAGRERDEARTRTLLAQTCARIMAEEGVRDFRAAKRKAAQRMGVSPRALMPSNVEIQTALTEYQRLFRADTQCSLLRKLRAGALDAMRFFSPFRPRLVGAVLAGTVGVDDDVQLHVFTDTPEEVQVFMMQHEIPVETGSRRYRMGGGEYLMFPTFVFGAGAINYDLTVFPLSVEREAPKSPVDGKAMRRATVRELEMMCAEYSGDNAVCSRLAR